MRVKLAADGITLPLRSRHTPVPRYDEVYWSGMAWLDSLPDIPD